MAFFCKRKEVDAILYGVAQSDPLIHAILGNYFGFYNVEQYDRISDRGLYLLRESNPDSYKTNVAIYDDRSTHFKTPRCLLVWRHNLHLGSETHELEPVFKGVWQLGLLK